MSNQNENSNLNKDEGEKLKPYLDPIGIPTVGVGHAFGKIKDGKVQLYSLSFTNASLKTALGKTLSSKDYSNLQQAVRDFEKGKSTKAINDILSKADFELRDVKEANKLRDYDVNEKVSTLLDAVTGLLGKPQANSFTNKYRGTPVFDALVSLKFNGVGRMPSTIRALHAGNLAVAYAEIAYNSNANRSDPRIANGIANRRAREARATLGDISSWTAKDYQNLHDMLTGKAKTPDRKDKKTGKTIKGKTYQSLALREEEMFPAAFQQLDIHAFTPDIHALQAAAIRRSIGTAKPAKSVFHNDLAYWQRSLAHTLNGGKGAYVETHDPNGQPSPYRSDPSLKVEVMNALAGKSIQQATATPSFIADRLQKGLIEAITGKAMTNSVQVNGKDIPIGHPEVLSRQDVFDLMQSKEYNQAARANHKQTVDTVRDFFEQASPGKVSLANGQRTMATINDILNRPSTAPAAMKDLGPIGSTLSSDQQQNIQHHFSGRSRSQQSKNSPTFGVFDGRNSDEMPDSWGYADAKTRTMSIGWRDPDGALQTITQSLDLPTSGPQVIIHTTSITNRHVVQNQRQKNMEEAAKQAQLDQARKNVAKQHQDYVNSTQAAHTANAKAVQEEIVSAARPSNPDFDAKHGLTSRSSSKSSAKFSGQNKSTSAISGALETTDEQATTTRSVTQNAQSIAQKGLMAKSNPTPQDVALKVMPARVKVGLNIAQATQPIGDAKGVKDVGWAQKSINRGIEKAEAQTGQKGMSEEEAAAALEPDPKLFVAFH